MNSLAVSTSGSRMRAAVLVGVSSMMISVAHADVPEDSGLREMAWAVTAAELVGVGLFALHSGADIKPSAPMLLLDSALLVGATTGAAFAAHYWEANERVPLAIHGAGWYGLPMFLLGTLIDGRDTGFGSRVGTAAYVLGAAGAVGGALVGTRVESTTGGYALLAAPAGGFLAGGIFIGLPLMFTGNTNQAIGRLMTGAVIGGVFGMGIATYMVLDHDTAETPVARSRALPMLDVTPGRVAFSFGGTF